MPNTRRRRFSVQNDIAGRDSSKMQNGLQNSQSDPANHISTYKSNKSKGKIYPNTSKNLTALEIVTECESNASIVSKKQCTPTIDKDVTASSSNIDLCNALKDDSSTENLKETTRNEQSMKEAQINAERTPMRRDRYPRQHRIKVRSPKRRTPPILDNYQKPDNDSKRSIGTIPINWNFELEVCNVVANMTAILDTTEDEERPSNHSFDDMCRICHGGEALSAELGPLISACSCRGTVGRVHVKCLERWLTESGKSKCELCGTKYVTKRVHRYGVPRALVMWILSQNAKQLMVDSLGIMLMSPLAVLAAWLSGRTLASLMTQQSHVTPWPLASTFVLACMTLVCYYCWIVSAATRHALGWWIWYRSQYEVRLQFQSNEE